MGTWYLEALEIFLRNMNTFKGTIFVFMHKFILPIRSVCICPLKKKLKSMNVKSSLVPE